MRYIDLSHTFKGNMPVFPGDSPAEVREVASLERHGYVNFELVSAMHVGTHIDGPAHMIPGGKQLVEFPVDWFFGRAVVVDARNKKEIGAGVLKGVLFAPGDCVLVATSWSEKYGSKDYYEDYPVLSDDFAAMLASARVKMVGIDGPSPDRPPFPVHKILLKNDILIIENLTNLTELVGEKNVEVVAMPLKIMADSALARVVAKVS